MTHGVHMSEFEKAKWREKRKQLVNLMRMYQAQGKDIKPIVKWLLEGTQRFYGVRESRLALHKTQLNHRLTRY